MKRILAQDLAEKDGRLLHLVCPICLLACDCTGNLNTHIRTVHEGRKDLVCPQCQKAFGRAGSLERHIRTAHEKEQV